MSDLNKTQLSESLLKDMKDFAKTGEDPIFWLANKKNVSIDEIITRMQSANIESVVALGYKTIDQWSKSTPPRTVRSSIAPITNTNRYSSFALVEDAKNIGKLRYPLVASYAAKNLFFESKTFSDYSRFINKIQSAYKIKIIEKNDSGSLFNYKRKGKIRAQLKNIGLGALNLCRKLTKKQTYKTSSSYKGKIILNGSIAIGDNHRYKFSQQEKLTRIIYALTTVTSKDIAKQNKVKLDKNVMAYANLLANVLICRAINYGNNNANRVVEASLSLQMCNTLAGLEIDTETLNKANDVAMQTALFTINKLGISKNEIMNAMHATGYTYYTQPQTIIEALVPRLTIRNEEIFVNNASQLLGIPYNSKSYENNITKTEANNINISKSSEIIANEEETKEVNKEPIKIEKKQLDALDNPPPEEIIYLGMGDQTDNKEIAKVATLAEHMGVKTTNTYLTKASAEKYIDKVVLSAIRKGIDQDLTKIVNNEDNSKATQRAKRRYNFLEHLYTYYDRNKNNDSQSLEENINKELDSVEVGDNVYAHSYAKSIVDLRHSIINDLFGDNEKILKPEGKEIAGMVNDQTEKKYNSKLSVYVKGALKKCLRTVFKEIDGKSFEQKNLVEPDSSK